MKNKMNYFKNNKSANWIILVLVILNIGLLTFIVIQNTTNKDYNKTHEIRQQRVSQFMHNELNLSPEQRDIFRESSQEYFHSMKDISSDIKDIKKKIYNEIFESKYPDNEKVDKLLDKLNKKQKELEKEQIKHFQNLKEVCNPEQEEKLKEIMNEMIDVMVSKQHQRDMHRGHRKYRNRR
jgi:Spy/CpxP family protein refolding chaperone